jgi:hypothetical protein
MVTTFRQSLPPGLHIRNYAFKSALLRSDRIPVLIVSLRRHGTVHVEQCDCTNVVIAGVPLRILEVPGSNFGPDTSCRD